MSMSTGYGRLIAMTSHPGISIIEEAPELSRDVLMKAKG